MRQQPVDREYQPMSASVANLIEGFVAAQAMIDNVNQDREVEVPIKDKQNPGQYKGKYKYRYATLPGILTHIRHALTTNGMWYTQFVLNGEMVTRLLHSSGEWMDTGNVPMPDIKGSPQDVGAIISFMKRYSLVEAMGLASEDDNDGDTESEINFHARGAPRASSTPPQEAGLEVPPMGWGDWARGLISTFADKKTLDELDAIKETNKRYINGVAKIDRAMFSDVQKAYENRKAVLGDSVPF